MHRRQGNGSLKLGSADTLYGLVDLGMGCPELGHAFISELRAIRGRFGLRVERDRGWKATKPLSAYAREARERIVA